MTTEVESWNTGIVRLLASLVLGETNKEGREREGIVCTKESYCQMLYARAAQLNTPISRCCLIVFLFNQPSQLK